MKEKEIKEKLERIDEEVTDSTFQAALKYKKINPMVRSETALATAFYCNHKHVTQEKAAEKFHVSRHTIQKHHEKVAEIQNLDKKDYMVKTEESSYKQSLLDAAEKFDWEKGVHYDTYEKNPVYGNPYTQARLLADGKHFLLNKALKGDKQE